VVDALEMALWRRKPTAGLVHHSDRGVQYTSLSFGKRLEEAGIVPSKGRAGSALDNAISEIFVASLKCELLYGHRFPSREAARIAIFDYIEGFYDPSSQYPTKSHRSAGSHRGDRGYRSKAPALRAPLPDPLHTRLFPLGGARPRLLPGLHGPAHRTTGHESRAISAPGTAGD
jgi:putative transposase